MSARTWHKGPPPFPGWWNASLQKADDIWRWWNGRYWSVSITWCHPSTSVGTLARRKDLNQHIIEWTDYWPKNARVPRVDPRSKT